MNRSQHSSNNHVFQAPPGLKIDECKSLPVTVKQFEDGSRVIQSFWRPTQHELDLLKLGCYVRVDVLGDTMPPIKVEVRP